MTLATSHGAAARPNASLLASSASSSSLVTLAGNGWPARLGAKPETPGQVAGEPLADAVPELLVLRAGPHPRPPGTDPRARRGGCRPAGASCLASNWPPRAGSAYQALVSSEATWWSSRSRPRSRAPPGGSATGRPGRAGGPRTSYRQLLHQTTTVTRALITEGVAPGDRVPIWSPNTHHWVLADRFPAQTGSPVCVMQRKLMCRNGARRCCHRRLRSRTVLRRR